MKKTRYTEERVAFALKQAKTGPRVQEVSEKGGLMRPLFTTGRRNSAAWG